MAGNASDIITAAADAHPDGIALVHAGTSITWGVLDARVTAFARGALARGLRRGDRVGIITANRTEFVVAHWGALRAGLISVPLNPALTAHELVQRTHDTAPALVICDATSEVAVREALMTNHLGTERVAAVGSAGWGDLVRPDRAPTEPATTDPESIAELLHTAGAGGAVQAAMVSHRALAAAVSQIGAVDLAPLTSTDVLLLAQPLVHAHALNGLLPLAASVGATVVIDRRADPDEAFDLIDRHGITVVAAPPTLFSAWSVRPEAGEVLRGVRLMSLGQAPVPPAVAAQLHTLSGERVWEGYSMVESTSLITCTAGAPRESGSVGQPLPGVDVVVVDVDGSDVDEGDPGDVLIRGANLFSGFWPDRAHDPGSDWYATRDVAFIDEHGGLHLVDRRHDLIVVNGFSVYPREVETVIGALNGVTECAVVGVDHPISGQAVAAYVVVNADSTVTSHDVREHCTSRLARFKCPTIVDIVNELPHDASGALARYRLREQQ